jgi:hypothetical protein
MTMSESEPNNWHFFWEPSGAFNTVPGNITKVVGKQRSYSPHFDTRDVFYVPFGSQGGLWLTYSCPVPGVGGFASLIVQVGYPWNNYENFGWLDDGDELLVSRRDLEVSFGRAVNGVYVYVDACSSSSGDYSLTLQHVPDPR